MHPAWLEWSPAALLTDNTSIVSHDRPHDPPVVFCFLAGVAQLFRWGDPSNIVFDRHPYLRATPEEPSLI